MPIEYFMVKKVIEKVRLITKNNIKQNYLDRDQVIFKI